MTPVQNFFNKYNGKAVRFNGSSNGTPQCTDLAAQYNTEVVGAPNVSDGNGAKDWWPNASRNFYTPIANTPSFVPMAGDIVVWGTGIGPYGHVAICSGEGDVNYFVSFDQNWCGQFAHFVRHNYSSVLGFLRPKKDVNFDQDAYNAEQARIAEANRVSVETAQKIADEAAKTEAARVAAEQKALADEQMKLAADLAAKKLAESVAAEAKAKSDEQVVVPEEKLNVGLLNRLLQALIDFISKFIK